MRFFGFLLMLLLFIIIIIIVLFLFGQQKCHCPESNHQFNVNCPGSCSLLSWVGCAQRQAFQR